MKWNAADASLALVLTDVSAVIEEIIECSNGH